MNPWIILISGILLIAVIQFLCCFCRYIPVKLIPLGLLAALFLWIFYPQIGGRDELPMCGMANAITLMLLLVPTAGIALGWFIYLFIWLWSGGKN